jgi:CBS domain-containing protein
MADTTLSELARLVAELAERVDHLNNDPTAGRLAVRPRALSGRLRPDDPAPFALGEQTVTVEVDVPARVVAETLTNERTGAVLVVTSEGPIGIVAERDLVAAMAASRPLDELEAGDLVSSALVTARPTDSIAEVAALMARHRVRHVPLVDDGRIVGVLSALDLAHALSTEGS